MNLPDNYFDKHRFRAIPIRKLIFSAAQPLSVFLKQEGT